MMFSTGSVTEPLKRTELTGSKVNIFSLSPAQNIGRNHCEHHSAIECHVAHIILVYVRLAVGLSSTLSVPLLIATL